MSSEKEIDYHNSKGFSENTNISNSPPNSKPLKSKINIDPENQRYPYCIVWTPLPLITWIIPCIGHVGICSSEGIIHDFAGPFYVSIDDMAFGNPTKYVILNLNEREVDDYDNAVDIGTENYNKQSYSFCCNNCHSFVAHCLNKLKYKGKNSYTMIHVWWMFLIRSKYISVCSYFKSNFGYLILLIIAGLIYYYNRYNK